jgi:hypothetical protein
MMGLLLSKSDPTDRPDQNLVASANVCPGGKAVKRHPRTDPFRLEPVDARIHHITGGAIRALPDA